MQTLTLREYEECSVNVSLSLGQRRALKDAGIDVEPPEDDEQTWILTPSSKVGVLNLGNLAIIVRPKLLIDRVMFLVAYAINPREWREPPFDLDPDADVLESIVPAFVRHTRQAIQRGLLLGYRREEEALHTVRGRIRFSDQINRRFGIPLPLEIVFDDFTEDIEENRLLKTALHRLAHLPIRSARSRRDVGALRPVFNAVSLGTYRREVPVVQYTRLNSHYRPAVELARLIIQNSSLEIYHGEVVGASFMLDMNRVFEQFLLSALREALRLSTSEWKRGRLTLDKANALRLEPDLSWWRAGRYRFVGDAKYKRLRSTSYPHADIYQMLAYCTAADLPSGLLVYAAGESEPNFHYIKHTDKAIEVASLDLSGSPENILTEVGRLAECVRHHTY